MVSFDKYNRDSLSLHVARLFDLNRGKYSINTIKVRQKLPSLVQPTPNVKASKIINEHLTSCFGSEQENKAKKIVAAAAVIAKHKKVLPHADVLTTPLAIASAADESMVRMKTAFKVGTGEMTVNEAVDKVVDYAAARTCAAIDRVVPTVKKIAEKAVEKVTPVVVNTVCSVVEKVCPPATVITTMVRNSTPYITETAKTVVNKGMEACAHYAKKAVTYGAEKAKSVIKSGIKKIISWFS